MIHIGFTGTQRRLTIKQILDIADYLESLLSRSHGSQKYALHYGDCIGADKEVFDIAKKLGYTTICHPPDNPKKRAFTYADKTREPKPYLERNHDIVDECLVLVAAPASYIESVRSGTWATIRYARKRSKGLVIIYP